MGAVTTGLTPLTLGSVKTFQLNPFLNGLPWNLTGGSATLDLRDPNGTLYQYAGQIVNGGAQATLSIFAPAGNWTFAWDCTDGTGIREISLPIEFVVQASP
jgi:hypothetical protein